VAFFAIGSYTMAILTSPELGFFDWNFWQALPLAIFFGVIAGVILGVPVLKCAATISLLPHWVSAKSSASWYFPTFCGPAGGRSGHRQDPQGRHPPALNLRLLKKSTI